MASLCRLQNLSAVKKILPLSPALRPVQQCRFIQTSDKKKDVAEVKSQSCSAGTTLPKTWVSWGFDPNDYQKDRDTANAVFFFSISLLLCGGGFILAYYPDRNWHNWATREAYLELRRRESAGLPLIDPNYVPPSQVILPSDEELGHFEIII